MAKKKKALFYGLDVETTFEGKLLFAAIGILNSSPELLINGREINGTRESPEDIVDLIKEE